MCLNYWVPKLPVPNYLDSNSADENDCQNNLVSQIMENVTSPEPTDLMNDSGFTPPPVGCSGLSSDSGFSLPPGGQPDPDPAVDNRIDDEESAVFESPNSESQNEYFQYLDKRNREMNHPPSS